MGFSNPIVGGGGSLVYPSIHSPNYVPNVSGWSIQKNGNAQFNDIEALGTVQVEGGSGNVLAGIDSLGNITGQTLSATIDINLAGSSLLGILAALPQGVIAEGSIPDSNFPYPAVAVNTEETLFELDAVLIGGRVYEITLSSQNFALSTASRITVNCHYTTDGSTPTLSSPLLWKVAANHDGTEDFNVWSPPVCHVEIPSGSSPVTYRMIVSAFTTGSVAADGKANWQIVNNCAPLNELRYTISDLGVDPGNTGVWLGGSGGSGGGTPKNYTKTYTCTNTYSYEGENSDSSPNPGYTPGALINHNGNAMQGDDQLGDNGNTSTCITWPSQIATDIAGATVTSMYLYLNNNHSWYDSGMTICVGKTTAAVGGGSRPAYTDPDLVEHFVSEGAGINVYLNAQLTAFVNAINNGDAFILYQPTSSRNYYGYFAGESQTGPPQLTVKYTK